MKKIKKGAIIGIIVVLIGVIIYCGILIINDSKKTKEVQDNVSDMAKDLQQKYQDMIDENR